MATFNLLFFRDLNPANILLSDDGSIKLTYFFRYPNIERPINLYAKERLYVAPEVFTLHSRVSFASDWWSFGAILFELVTLQVNLSLTFLAKQGCLAFSFRLPVST